MSGSRSGPIDKFLDRVSTQLRPRVREIVGLTDTFCRDHLDDGFRDISRGRPPSALVDYGLLHETEAGAPRYKLDPAPIVCR